MNLNTVRDSLYRPGNFVASWQAVRFLEHHDRQRLENDNDREPRLAALADSNNSRSWYPRSRTRVASFSETIYWNYQPGFLGRGRWLKVFNSDYYDNLPNPGIAGNNGGLQAQDLSLHGLPCSTPICNTRQWFVGVCQGRGGLTYAVVAVMPSGLGS
ncbi:MAG: hypothetical protein HY080_12080 [Gammaproteobacteria bacterium]|nr:hypothetical protein [Gammaproteobacteria bacterium]